MLNKFCECSVGSEGFEQGEMVFGAREDMSRVNLFACRLQLENFQMLLVKDRRIYLHNHIELGLQELHFFLVLLGSFELSLQELHLFVSPLSELFNILSHRFLSFLR